MPPKLPKAAESPQHLPALEADPGAAKLYLLDKEIQLGPDYSKLSEIRCIKEAQFTLDSQTLEVLSTLADGVNHTLPTLLEGPTSASKTSTIEYLAAISGYTCHRVNLKGQTDTSELLGKFVPDATAEPGKPQWKWQDGLLVVAMKEGHWIILDEINLAEPQIIEAFNSVLETPPSVTLTDNGGVKIGPGGQFPVHPNFRVFATMNPGYRGRQPLSPAFQNRWTNRKHLKAPQKAQLEAMLIHHTFGEQPSVKIHGEEYQSPRSSAKPGYERLRELDRLPVQTLLSRLAAFHEAISQKAENSDIGRDLDPGHIFTRRDLDTFLGYIARAEKFNRKTAVKTNLTSNPVRIVLDALELVYLNKLHNGDDITKVKALLGANNLDEKALKDLFAVKSITAATSAGAAAATNPKPIETGVEIPPDLLEKLRDNFNFATDKLCNFYNILQQNPEGNYQYESSYSETTGEVFVMKSFEEVMAGFDEKDIANIQSMIDRGEEPILVPVPLDDLTKMGQKVDAKKADLVINTSDTFVTEDLKSLEVKYYPDNFETEGAGDNIKLKSFGGISKAELIRQTGGFDYIVIPTKQDMDGDDSIIYTDATKTAIRRLAAQQKLLFDQQKVERLSGVIPETNLITQALLLATGTAGSQEPLAPNTFDLLAGIALPDTSRLANGYWSDDRVFLHWGDSNYQDDLCRVRGSVRGFQKP